MSGIEIEDVRIESIRPIKSPAQLKEEVPNQSKELIVRTRQEIRNILHGDDQQRLVMIVGPCSIHDPDAAIKYAQRLGKVRSQVEDDLLVVMRAYFEKPRTTVGWTGLVYDPHLDGSTDPVAGLSVSRRLLADINSEGIPCAVEFLDLITPQYFADTVSWGAIGARSTEDQTHRQLASGLSMTVGFKNSTGGNIQIAVEGMITAANPHTFFSIDNNGLPAEVRTKGNPDTHVVLRGGAGGSNYNEESVEEAIRVISNSGLLTDCNRPVMIDCSHGNSNKDHRRQPDAVYSVLEQIQSGRHRIMGLMIESNLREGRQNWAAGEPLKYGVSITDACIGWEETENLLLNCARKIQPKRFVLA